MKTIVEQSVTCAMDKPYYSKSMLDLFMTIGTKDLTASNAQQQKFAKRHRENALNQVEAN